MSGPYQKRFAQFEDQQQAEPATADAGLPLERTGQLVSGKPPTLRGQTVFVVDAHSLIYQVFHVMGEMTSPTGRPVSAVFGFARDLLDLLQRYQPDYMICAFDKSGVTFRNQLYTEYKANRDPMPDDLREQMPHIRRMLAALQIPALDADDYEADDIMATVARRVQQLEGDCVLVTTDKDCRQLISDRVKLLNLRKNQLYDAAALQRDWGIRPDQVVDFQAMVGDSVDNIPGIESIGPKSARDLLSQFGSLAGLYEHVDQIKGKKREKIEASRQRALLSRQLVQLEAEVPLSIDWARARVGEVDVTRAKSVFLEFGFRSLLDRVEKLSTQADSAVGWSSHYEAIESVERLDELVGQLSNCRRVALVALTTAPQPRWGELVGVGLAWDPGGAAYVPIRAPDGEACLPCDQVRRLLAPLLENEQIEKVGENLKSVIVALRGAQMGLAGKLFDLMVADYLLDSGQRSRDIADLAERYLGRSISRVADLLGSGKQQKKLQQLPVRQVAAHAGQAVDAALRMAPIFLERLRAEQLAGLFDDLEMPLVGVLAEMEFTGISVDPLILQSLSDEFGAQIRSLQGEIYRLAGKEFNIDSRNQLAEVLFERAGLPVLKRTKTGPSTDIEVLNQLAKLAELPAHVITYRQFMKLKSTYTDALIQLIHPQTGRVHTTFLQDVAATGRLSSKDPNLQNIPIRTAEGRKIRRAFIPRPGWKLLMADYSQIELRMLAHFSEDSSLAAAFQNELDIHTAVAAEVFQRSPDDVTESHRRRAKAINFGIIYGQSPFGLAKSIEITTEEAAEFIQSYFSRYPGVEHFIREILEKAHQQGYVSTILGRRRRIDGVRPATITSKTRQRNLPERIAINTVIQGSAADLIKLAMIHIHRRLQQWKQHASLLLQIHDELVFEVAAQRVGELEKIVTEEMVTAVPLRVPLQVDIEIGDSWATSP